ncbi:MAG: general stress protein [Coleofasciculaceae cyanobacterium]
MVLEQHKRAVGVFSTRREAEVALKELRDSNFVMDKVSVIAQDTDGVNNIAGADVRDDIRDPNDNKADEGAKAGALTGGALGGLTGLLVGLGTLAIPGIGPVMLAGATATAIATTLAGGAIGAAAGSLLGALIGLGIPEDDARNYNERISRGHYLVMIEGTDAEIARAQAILHRGGVEDWAIYDIPNAGETATAYATTPAYGTPGVATAVAATAGAAHHTTGTKRRAVGVFPHRRDAEAAIRDLRDSGFNMNQLSLVGKDVQSGTAAGTNDVKTGNKADEGAKAGAATGGALGGLAGLLVGLGALAIPGIGPVIAGGALATALASTLAGGAIGAAAGGLTGALVGLGIPEDRARFYNDRFNRGDYLVMVDGTDDEIHTAHAILNRHGIQDWGVYDYSNDHDRSNDATPSRVATGVATGVAAGTHGNSGYHRAVGVFPHRRDAETAIRELRDAGFNMNQISLVGKDDRGNSTDLSGNLADRTKTDEGAKAGAATGGALGGLTGLLVGLGALAIPGVGPVIAGGALATALASTVAGGAIGAAAGGLTGALVGLGIPDDRARFYNDRVNHGDYLVMVDGTESEILQAETILSRRGIQNWAIFDAPDHGNRTGNTATRNVVDNTTSTVNQSRADYQVVDDHPEVVIIDRRDQTP